MSLSPQKPRTPGRSRSPKRDSATPEKWPSAADSERYLCFVRHAQALHNVYDENLWTPDNPLTDEGVQQCKVARNLWGKNIFSEADLIIVSPMTRALNTAYHLNGEDLQNKSRWLVSPMCAEKLSGATCDEGTPKSEQVEKVPWMKDLPGFQDLDEKWWTLPREEEELRIAAFMDFLRKRTESKIVVVSHGGFLEYIVGHYMPNVTHHVMSMAQVGAVKRKMHRSTLNLSNALSEDYEKVPLKQLVKEKLVCLQGLGRKKASVLEKVGLKTVHGLANWKYARWAESICILAPTEIAGAKDTSKMEKQININKALVAEWEGYSFTDLLEAPISAFEGLSAAHGDLLKSVGLLTIKDLGTWKYFMWSKAICILSEVETPDGSS